MKEGAASVESASEEENGEFLKQEMSQVRNGKGAIDVL